MNTQLFEESLNEKDGIPKLRIVRMTFSYFTDDRGPIKAPSGSYVSTFSPLKLTGVALKPRD